MTRTTTCKWCKKTMNDDPGAFYHESDCHSRDVRRRMREARERGVDSASDEWKKLARELEYAEYVGD